VARRQPKEITMTGTADATLGDLAGHPAAAPTNTTGTSTGTSTGSPSKYMLLGLGLATWMEFYTYDGVNLVLPDMAGTLGLSQDQASWILTTYLSALFFGVPLSSEASRWHAFPSCSIWQRR
jgi:hypothetical protein